MLKKTILLENKTNVNVRNLQLIIKSEIRESTFPIEDIGFLVVDHPEIFISMTAMNLLVDNNACLLFVVKIICQMACF